MDGTLAFACSRMRCTAVQVASVAQRFEIQMGDNFNPCEEMWLRCYVVLSVRDWNLMEEEVVRLVKD
ncbi:hypothetical protein QJS10_CPA07g00680 [Acorus calamus]|uniref:Uncharacterized protein n=1 Tax=Acorus calamus TaxID=4465 RepID=A0AAV9EFV4_ACOCL|nr:hypothetical protein QJS10_CPA07g00680 [Acorus calamus]